MRLTAKPRSRRENMLIWLAAVALSLLFMLPRLAVLRQAGNMNRDIGAVSADFWAKTAYSLLLALVFLYLNLRFRKFRMAGAFFDPDRLADRILLNVVGFFVFRFLVVQTHIFFFDPFLNERVFRVFFNVSLALELILVMLIAHMYHLVLRNQELAIGYNALRKAHAEARFEALKSQLKPHFLFNSFNSLKGLITKDPEAARRFVDNLSDVLRCTLTTSHAEAVSLAEEMQLVAAYTGLLKIRHGDKIRIDLSLPVDLAAYRIPPMGIQALIENAVKHNNASSKKPLTIHIFTEKGLLVVENNVQSRLPDEPGTGLGLLNLNERCRYLFGQELSVKRSDDVFSVGVPLIKNSGNEYLNN
ncbi:hypothetical protein C7T94_05315 [Pedobacter yulinensis]|uniref:Signal transduction histidine kinase internal region domain-containing protein n=1 Tax=Pedobacter yulinensis TaxID=2126353 RepID=A0A2T3HNY9_9SPHI|nr:histidine kinase [Pedobacter yulinensis]PST84149.1 hypothetical protein C7T94_05315 [Pedobacter yulinensis]